MKQFNKFLTVILIVLVILLFTWPLIIAEIWNVGAGNKPIIRTMVETIVDTVKNRKNYDKYLNEYIEYKFGEAVASKLKISTGGRADTDKYSYRVRFDEILDKNFVIYVYSTGGCYDNFSEVLSKDQKFQHLYSEWIKKQVGIEDENVELKFKEAMKGARMVGKEPYIEFDNINSLDNLEDNICKNIHNLYLHTVVIDNFISSNANDVLSLVKDYERLLKPYVFMSGDNVLWFGVEIKNSVDDEKDPYSYSILFDYNTNEKKYFIYYENRPIENNKSEYISFN